VRSVGVEEELLLVDPDTGRLCPVAQRALRAYQDEAPDGAADVVPELFRQQVEAVTEPCLTLDELEAQLRSGRRTVTTLSDQVGAAAVAMPTPVLSDDDADDITREPRYERIRAEFGELARTSLVCAMHVHVEVAGAEEGVRALDAIRPWLPVLLAVSANSPYFHGRDTGYASWRTQVRTRWPSSGTGEAFGSARAYNEVRRKLTRWGAALDDGMVYFDARLSANYPTLEVRVADVCTDLDDAVLVAALTRALVTTAAEGLANSAEAGLDHDGHWRSELLRAATWRASRYGLSNRLVHPATMQLAPPREVLAYLIGMLRPALENDGDLRLVQDLTERLLSRGGGATRQRRVFETDGSLGAVVADLVRQTEASAAR
jgi:glutamate---cysteine ligase / carboxylate-amine ligase